MFVGPVVSVPMILLSIYGIGYGREIPIPLIMKIFMSFSYLRHGLEGVMAALYGNNRGDSLCPDTEMFCMFKKPSFLLELLGFTELNYLTSVAFLIAYYLLFTTAAFLMIRHRLSFTSTNLIAVQYVMQFVKKNFNFSAYNY